MFGHCGCVGAVIGNGVGVRDGGPISSLRKEGP